LPAASGVLHEQAEADREAEQRQGEEGDDEIARRAREVAVVDGRIHDPHQQDGAEDRLERRVQHDDPLAHEGIVGGEIVRPRA
jgi:hypothetical protein